MNENPDWLVQAGRAEEGHEGGLLVTLQLPPDVAMALQQRIQQSGQPQTEVIVSLLRSACGLAATVSADRLEVVEAEQIALELQALRARLTDLEALIPRLESLEGKLIAF